MLYWTTKACTQSAFWIHLNQWLFPAAFYSSILLTAIFNQIPFTSLFNFIPCLVCLFKSTIAWIVIRIHRQQNNIHSAIFMPCHSVNQWKRTALSWSLPWCCPFFHSLYKHICNTIWILIHNYTYLPTAQKQHFFPQLSAKRNERAKTEAQKRSPVSTRERLQARMERADTWRSSSLC